MQCRQLEELRATQQRFELFEYIKLSLARRSFPAHPIHIIASITSTSSSITSSSSIIVYISMISSTSNINGGISSNNNNRSNNTSRNNNNKNLDSLSGR